MHAPIYMYIPMHAGIRNTESMTTDHCSDQYKAAVSALTENSATSYAARNFIVLNGFKFIMNITTLKCI